MTALFPAMQAKIPSPSGVSVDWNQTPLFDVYDLATEMSVSRQTESHGLIVAAVYQPMLRAATGPELIRYEVEEAPATAFSSYEPFESARYIAERLIRRIGRQSTLPYRERLVERLLALLAITDEEEPDGPGISTGSLEAFLSFLQMNPNFKDPSITLTPRGNIYATWKKSSDEILSLHFLPVGAVRFVIFRPDEHRVGRVTRLWGVSSLSSLFEVIKPHSVLNWATA